MGVRTEFDRAIKRWEELDHLPLPAGYHFCEAVCSRAAVHSLTPPSCATPRRASSRRQAPLRIHANAVLRLSPEANSKNCSVPRCAPGGVEE